MLFGDVIAIALSIIGFLISLQGLWLVAHALWPARVEATATRSGSGVLACFLTGLPVTGAIALFAAIVARAGTFGQISAFGVALAYIVYANAGVAGFVTHIGRRLSSPADVDRPWKATIRGGIVVELAWLIPVAGWLGLLPITLILGAGAMTLSLFGSGKRSEITMNPWAPPPMPGAAAPVITAPVAVTSISAPPAVTAPPALRALRPRPVPGAESRELEPAAPAGVE